MPPREATGRHILVVDDEPEVVQLLLDALGMWDFTGTAVRTLAEARTSLTEKEPLLVLADVGLPDGSGVDLLPWSNEQGKDIPIIIVTGADDIEVAVKALNQGAQGFLRKPFDLEELHQRIDTIARKREYAEARRYFETGLRSANEELQKRLSAAIEKSQKLFMASLTSLAHAIDARDPYTRLHSSNVSRYASATAALMGMNKDEREIIRLAGELHDIGKIGVPEAILLKPAKLTDEEYDVMKEHPGRGAYILSPLPDMDDVVTAVRSHHERNDGKGYPDGLQGDDIPPLARILSVCDAWDAMRTDRPYRKARPLEEAREVLLEEKGGQFVPDAVDAFLEANV